MDFSNLKITLHIDGSVAMQKNSGAFDSVLAMLHFNEQKNAGTFNGDYTQQLDFIECTDGVYHTSFAVFGNVGYYDKEALIKKFDHDLYARYGTITTSNDKPLQFVKTVQGPYKAALFSVERMEIDTIAYYVRGGKERIASLLRRLKFIGKKSSLGWGKIKRITIEETIEDLSMVKNGKLMRNLPVTHPLVVRRGNDKVALFRPQHPYWSKTGLVECCMP